MSRFREAIEAARRVVELIRDDNPKAPLTTQGKDIVTACRYLLTLADAQDDLTALAEGRGMTKDAQTVTPTAEDRETARKLSWSFPAGDNDSGDREQLADEIAIALATLRAQMQAQIATEKAKIASLHDEATRQHDHATAAEAALEKARQTIMFFASVIKSGEPWTQTCEDAMRAALAEKPGS